MKCGQSCSFEAGLNIEVTIYVCIAHGKVVCVHEMERTSGSTALYARE